MKFVKPSKIKQFLKHQICCGNNILLRFIAALKACVVACTVNAGFPSIVTSGVFRVGGPEARLKRGPFDDVIIHSQP